jgi:hypothetical protein
LKAAASTQRPRARRRLLAPALATLVLGAGLGAVLANYAVQRIGAAPRQLGPYIERRADGHNPAIFKAGHWLGARLVALDRADDPGALPVPLPALRLGAQPQAMASSSAIGHVVEVGDVNALRAALARATAGDVIVLQPGNYRIDAPLDAATPASAGAPIVVRARQPGSVVLEQSSVEGFRVTGPWWRFENLVMRGTCGADDACEHAFHVSAGAHHFAAVNNTLSDFNAHFKINGDGARFPDHGMIESNTLTNTHPRHTANPVTPIDLVAASDWVIRHNLISDFIKDGGDGISYGAFVKGGGARNLFEQNVVWCESRLRGLPGQRVGLSLGGGGTGKPYCRDHACVVEQQQGAIRGNLIAACSDAGVYLNNAAQSAVLDNSVVDTAGVEVRFAGSSADIGGNLAYDGAIRTRNGAVVRERDNLSAPLLYAYLGYHPVRAHYAAPTAFDFAWHGEAPRRGSASGIAPDLCGRQRGTDAAYGAFDSFAPCLAPASRASSSSNAAN